MSREMDVYKRNLVYSSTQGELLILLYNQIIKNLNQIKSCLKNNNFEKSGIIADKTEKIFVYLIQTLNFNYKISNNLEDLYIFFNKEIYRAIRNNSIEDIDKILEMVKELRDTWREADKLAK